MAQHGRHRLSARSRRTSRKVSQATLGTHVARQNAPSRNGAQSSRVSYKNARIGARASESHVDTFMPTATSGEDQAAYRRRSQQRRYVEAVQRRARFRRVAVFVVAALVVVGLAAGAGFLAFRGVIGSHMALRGSNAVEALSAPEAGEPTYTLVIAELGAVAQKLDQPGPDMIVLVREDRAAGKLDLIGIPSSLKVTVDNDTRRLADMADAGDASLISAVESYAKIDVNHFVKLGEGDLAAIVDAFGDIEVTFDQVVDDPNAGDVYFPLGTYTLNGAGAVTYMRASNLKMGKTDQVNNQVAFTKLLLERIVGSPRGCAAEIEAIDDWFQTDVSLRDLEGFAQWAGGLGEGAVSCSVVPGYFTASSDIVGDNGELYVSKASDFEALVGKTAQEGGEDPESAEAAAKADPASFTVEVINGTDIVGAARTTAEALDAAGFRIADVGNAEQQVYDETLVIYHTRNTPAKQVEPVFDDEGNVIEGAGEGESGEDAAWQDGADGDGTEGASNARTQKETAEAQEAADEAERKLGVERANAVIDAIGLGRIVEGDMYYSFNADVLLVIGYDYKPVA